MFLKENKIESASENSRLRLDSGAVLTVLQTLLYSLGVFLVIVKLNYS